MEPVSQTTLQLFHNDPAQGPNALKAKLDTSGNSLTEMKQSPWNRLLIYRLAQWARMEVELSQNPSEYGHPDVEIQWDRIFEDKIVRILRDVNKARRSWAVSSNKKQLRSIRAWVSSCNVLFHPSSLISL